VLWPLSRIVPGFLFKKTAPFRVFPLKGIKDAQGSLAQGYVITKPYLEDRFLKEAHNILPLDDIVAAAEIAHRLGVKILGLGGFPASVSEQLHKISKKVAIPVTSGNALFAWSIFETIFQACREKKIDLARTNLVVLGAASSLGVLCSKKLSTLVSRVVVCDGDIAVLKALKEKIAAISSAAVTIEQDSRKAVKEADIVIICAAQEERIFNAGDLRPGGLICDVSWCGPARSRLKPGHGCVVVNSGLVKLPKTNDFIFDADFGKNVICASMAEVILLALENKFLPFGSGSQTNFEKLEDIADIAARHGFEIWFSEAHP